MSFEFFPGVGMVHLNTVKPRKGAPAGTIHRWSGTALRGGQPVTCTKCGCKKAYTRDYRTLYVAPGGRMQTEMRPPCTGTPPLSPITESTTA